MEDRVALSDLVAEPSPLASEQAVELPELSDVEDHPTTPQHVAHVLLDGPLLTEPACVRVDVRGVEVRHTVVVQVAEGQSHAAAEVQNSGFPGHFAERPVAQVPVQTLAAEVVGDADVRPAVAVIVARRHRQAPAGVSRAARLGHIHEPAAFQVVEEEVGLSVGGEERQPRELLEGVTVRSDVDIQETVAVEVQQRGGACRRDEIESHLGRSIGEDTRSVVDKESARSQVADDKQVAVAIVVEVGEESSPSLVEALQA